MFFRIVLFMFGLFASVLGFVIGSVDIHPQDMFYYFVRMDVKTEVSVVMFLVGMTTMTSCFAIQIKFFK